ncbi:MAG: ankyrin repeat domain-containing protein [Bacteroidetes bacterium]|jgi:ankyrin repeat protein|nr:ankyrin repeat domain-containing protein [Bacteroidota bacterium]
MVAVIIILGLFCVAAIALIIKENYDDKSSSVSESKKVRKSNSVGESNGVRKSNDKNNMGFEQGIFIKDYNTIKHYLDTGIDVNSNLSTGFPPISELITPKQGLQIVKFKPNENIIKLLLESGADVNRKSKIMPQNTPLIQASYYGYANIVKLLLKYDAKINDQNIEGATALMMAVMAGHVDLVKLLLLKGANKNLGTYKLGMTALDGAYRNNNMEIIKLLKD